MKTCPKCGRVYGDEYNFCLEDGTLLKRAERAADPDKTEFFVLPEVPDSIPTVDILRPTEPSPHIPGREDPEPPLPTIPDFRPRPVIGDAPSTDEIDRRENTRLFFLNRTASAVLVILAFGFIGLILYETVDLSDARSLASSNTNREPAVQATATPAPTHTSTPKPTSTPTPTPTQTPAKPVQIENPEAPSGPTFPDPAPPDLSGRYYAREYQGDDSVVMHFDVYNQDGTDFSIRDIPDKLTGAAHLDRKSDRTYVGYVQWYFEDGRTDEEELYICGNFDALCGKLPFQNWYFIATHRAGE